MKKDSIGVLFLLIAIGWVSCMGESEEKTNYQRYGVAALQPAPALYTTDGEMEHIITSSAMDTLADLKDGDCFLLQFRANLFNYAEGEAVDADIHSIEPIAAWTLEGTEAQLPDTTFVNVAEDTALIRTVQFFSPAIAKSQLIRNRLFLQLTLNDRRETQQENYIFQYNPAVVAEQNGRRIYDLYLRAERREANDSLIGKWIQTEALVLDQLIREAGEAEKQIGNDSLHIRLNYPTGFSLDSTLVRWASANVYSIVL
ncbi:hypothetical protein [Parabacteroides sp. PF5-6]|uniref:hypothetical protein n=1 Tax=Parabacteroides sp. PF5-6 TaxID=1742403 RepID=UPI0024068F6D|nr:hypothetical protein [Parabacteroides sp. PF5-6]MDF9829057.1 hypothetical protein [Parabacteroides sp. PF5-6]